jgi:spermidine synthase
MILFLFFCSGATALVYEVVWSKYLSLMLGSTVQAQTVVLAVFMGGLALGNRFIGARSDLLQRPLAAYGYLEVMIGLYAFFFAGIYSAGDWLFVTLGTRLFESPIGMFLLKSGLSIGLLLPPTILMGGTLPLLAAWLQRQSDDAGRWSARFYSTNSLGAVCGSFLAGFYLIRSLGLVSAVQMTALFNVLIGIIAIGLGRKYADDAQPQVSPATTAVPDSTPTTSGAMRWATLLVALTGGVSMGLEVLASRSLTLIFGASLQAFAVVLMAFILGIGAGSAAVASPRLKRWRSEGAIIGLLLAAAGIVGLLVLGIEQWVEIYRQVKVGIAPTRMGYRFYQAITGGFSLIILGLPAALIGAVLPLCLRWVSDSGKGFGNRVGQLLTWNTLGAVVGVLLTGFILMPKAGLRNAFNILAIALCVPAILLALSGKRRAWLATSSLLAIGLIASSITAGEGWKHVLSSGVFRSRETIVDPNVIPQRKASVKILFYEDAPDATVTVEQNLGRGTNAEIGLRINGKAEASTHGDLTTQLLLAHLPMLARPQSEDVFVLGLASGISCSGFLAHPIKHLTVADNCEPVTRAVDYFAPWNRGVKTNAVTRLRIEDARTVLKLEPKNYDIVVSEPSNPWFASVGSVFSREFYQLAAKRLKPGGLMVQWFHVYEMHDGIVDMVLRTFGSVFPAMEIWDTNDGDIILLGSDRPWTMSLDSLRRTYAIAEVRKDLESIGLGTPEALLARLLASQRTASAIAGPGPIQTDGFPVLEYEAPIAFFIGTKAQRIARFDERTWQSGFASEERRRILASLDDQVLRSVFERDTINRELWISVAERLKRSHLSATKTPKVSFMTSPSVFNASLGESESELPPDATEELKTLIAARVALQKGETNVIQNVEVIRNTLAKQLVAAGDKTPERSSANLAAIAARACILERQFKLANDLITLGMRFDQYDPELAFLSRMLERESGGTEKIAGS